MIGIYLNYPMYLYCGKNLVYGYACQGAANGTPQQKQQASLSWMAAIFGLCFLTAKKYEENTHSDSGTSTRILVYWCAIFSS